MAIRNSGSAAQLSDVKRTINGLRTAIATIERLDKDRSANFVEIQKQVAKINGTLEAKPQFSNLLREWLASYELDIDEARKAARLRFGTELERLLRPEGIVLSGHLPTLRAGIFTVEPDFDKGRVILWYGNKQERIETVASISPNEVVKRIKAQHKLLTAGSFDQEKFLKQLHSAYRSALRRSEKPDGEPAPIISTLNELAFQIQPASFQNDPLKEKFRSYGRMQFSYDLHRLRQRRLIDQELVLMTATRAYTTKKQNFLWIPNNQRGDGSTYSHILFKGVK